MSLLWFLIGAGTVLIIWGLLNWKKNNSITLSWQSLTGIVLGVFVLLFAIAWSISSIAEGENQAAGMGLIFFGGLTLIIFAITRRKILKDNPK